MCSKVNSNKAKHLLEKLETQNFVSVCSPLKQKKSKKKQADKKKNVISGSEQTNCRVFGLKLVPNDVFELFEDESINIDSSC